jgi:hypothetical protein
VPLELKHLVAIAMRSGGTADGHGLSLWTVMCRRMLSCAFDVFSEVFVHYVVYFASCVLQFIDVFIIFGETTRHAQHYFVVWDLGWGCVY